MQKKLSRPPKFQNISIQSITALIAKKIDDCVYAKNIWTLGFRKEQAVLIDDIPMQMECQPENGINIKAFEGEECDRELYKLYPFLQKLNEIEDIRPVPKRLNDHINGSFRVEKVEICEYSDEYELDFDEGCSRKIVKPSCCPASMFNRNSLYPLEVCLSSSTSTHTHSDSES